MSEHPANKAQDMDYLPQLENNSEVPSRYSTILDGTGSVNREKYPRFPQDFLTLLLSRNFKGVNYLEE